MTRIVMLTNTVAPDKLGGLERYVRELSERLAASGNDVVVVAKTVGAMKPGLERVSDTLSVVRYAPPSKRNPLFALLYPVVIARAVDRALGLVGATSGAVRAGDVVIHGHFPVPMLPVLLRRLPFVYTMHAPVFRELLGERQGSYALPRPLGALAVRLLSGLERAVVTRATRLITLSRFVRAEAEALAGRDLPGVLVPGGLDVDRFAPGTASRKPGTPTLFAARRLVERTGVELLIEAMPAVIAALPDARLFVAGDGPRRGHIETLIGRLGVQDAVTLLGVVPESELLDRYRGADLCVTPTLYLEGFGLSTAEAMACGTPVVVTPAGANSELVVDLPPALLADDVSAPALAQAIVASWRVLSVEPRLGERARSVVAPSMGWPAVAVRHEEIYNEIVRAPIGRDAVVPALHDAE